MEGRTMLTITSTRTRLRALLAAAAAALLLAGCGGGDDDDDGLGPNPNTQSSFTATLSGALSGTYNGESVYGSNNLGDFGIALGGGTQSQGFTLVFVRYAGGTPGAQQYDLADMTDVNDNPEDGRFRVVVAVGSGASAQALAGKSGRLTITSTSGNRLKGTFQFTAVPMSGGPSTVTVSGTFDAVGGTVVVP
jgi:hypothetical protein